MRQHHPESPERGGGHPQPQLGNVALEEGAAEILDPAPGCIIDPALE